MPILTESFFRNVALGMRGPDGETPLYSKRQAKQLARGIVTAPWFPYVVETLNMPSELTYHDPTGEDAVHNVLMEALMRNTAMEVSA